MFRKGTTGLGATAIMAGMLTAGLAAAEVFAAPGRGDRQTTRPAGRPAAPPGMRRLRAALPGGASIELFGLGRGGASPSKGPWWTVDGRQLSKEPTGREGKRIGPMQTMGRRNGPSVQIYLEVQPGRVWTGQGRMAGYVRDEAAVETIDCNLFPSKDRQRFTMRIPCAWDRWQTLTATDGKNPIRFKSRFGAVSLTAVSDTPASRRSNSMTITATYRLPGRQVRLTAVDTKGKEHVLRRGGDSMRMDGDGTRNRKYHLGRSHGPVKVFRIQTRPYRWVEFRNLALRPGKRTEVQVAIVHDQSAVPSAGKWGEAIEGVAVRLRAQKRIWAVGRTPAFKIDMCNRGLRGLWIVPVPSHWELEVDGVWYRPTIAASLPGPERLPFAPHIEHDGLPFSPVKRWGWVRRSGRGLLTFTPGKHAVRVAFTARVRRELVGKEGVRAVSNPVEIEIAPAGTKGPGNRPGGS